MDPTAAKAVFTTVTKGLLTAWKSYKTTGAARHQDPFTALIRSMMGTEMSDVEAAKYLAHDISEIRRQLEVKKTDRAFKKIVKDSF